MRFFDLLEAEEYSTVLYHGTGIENVKDIVLNRQGLELRRPRTTSGFGTSAIYLTPNIKLAARYAMGGFSTAPRTRIPAILEIKLFNQKRYRRMKPDPLDRSDTAWQDHYNDYDSPEHESIRELEKDIREFVTRMGQRYQFQVPSWLHIDLGYEIEALQGFQLHDYIRKLIAQYAGNRYNKNDINNYLNHGEFAPETEFFDDQVVITHSGTLQLTPNFWTNQHQTMYFNKIPASAVKAVWVRKSDFPKVSGKEENFGTEWLPSEVVHHFETLKDQLDNLGEEVGKIIEQYWQDTDDKEWYVSELERVKKEVSDYDKLVDLIDKIIVGLDDEDFDYQPLVDKLEEKGREMASYLYDDFYPDNPMETDVTTWVRVTNFKELA